MVGRAPPLTNSISSCKRLKSGSLDSLVALQSGALKLHSSYSCHCSSSAATETFPLETVASAPRV